MKKYLCILTTLLVLLGCEKEKEVGHAPSLEIATNAFDKQKSFTLEFKLGQMHTDTSSWDAFLKQCEQGIAKIDITYYTIEGDPIILTLLYNQNDYTLYHDARQDRYGGKSITSSTYSYIKRMDGADLLTQGYPNNSTNDLETYIFWYATNQDSLSASDIVEDMLNMNDQESNIIDPYEILQTKKDAS